MSLAKKTIAFLTPLVLAASGVVAATTATATAPIACSADSVRLVVQNGSNQYFECDQGTAGTIRQTFSSKNPWVVDPAAPALFQTPTAHPQGAVGQIFTGATQGVGVISSADSTGTQRDSISGSESLTIRKDALARNFSGLRLGVNVLQAGTVISVDAIAADGSVLRTDGTGSLTAGRRNADFFRDADEAVNAVGFTIRVDSASPTGIFSIDGRQDTRFFLVPSDTIPPGPVTGLSATYDTSTANAVALTWTNPTDPDLESIIVRRADGPTAPALATEGEEVALETPTSVTPTSVTDTGVTPNKQYSYAVFTRDNSDNTSAATTTTITTNEPVTNLTATSDIRAVLLAWKLPSYPTPPDEVIVRRGAPDGSAPLSATDGVGVAVTGSESTVDSNLDPEKTYSYAVFTKYGTEISNSVTASAKTFEGLAVTESTSVTGKFGDRESITSQVTFLPDAGDLCNVEVVPILEHTVFDFDGTVDDTPQLSLYSLGANWVVPDKGDPIPSRPEEEYGNCLFRWTTTGTGLTYSLAPLMDYDGPGTDYEPEDIPVCSYDSTGALPPPPEYGVPAVTDRPFCLESDSFDGATATKTTTVLVWNDPWRVK
jgi:hypothetical protein